MASEIRRPLVTETSTQLGGKLVAVAPKCKKTLTLENSQLQYTEFVEKKMNRLLRYEDANLLNYCVNIMVAHADTNTSDNYHIGTGFHHAARCQFEQC
eukprot:6211923-Pleurochrysis_carterae.AAC.2